ncbi:unnamed protein product, partial [Phaeothamnion confervicola]
RESAAELDRELVEYPESVRGLKLKARLLTSQKDDSAALAAWDHVLEVAPRDGDAYLERGRIRYARQDWAGALSDLRRATEISPESDLANYNFAIALLRSAQDDRARSQ